MATKTESKKQDYEHKFIASVRARAKAEAKKKAIEEQKSKERAVWVHSLAERVDVDDIVILNLLSKLKQEKIDPSAKIYDPIEDFPEEMDFDTFVEICMRAEEEAEEEIKANKTTKIAVADTEEAEAELVESHLAPEDKCFESNYIARSSWRTRNVWVQRVAAILISKLSAKDTDFKAHDIPISDIVGDGRAGSTYRQLREDVGKVLMAQVVLLYEINGSGDYTVRTVFKDGIKYLEKKDCIRVSLNPALKQYYLELKNNFTVYSLPEFLKIRGTYAQTLYRYLKSWESEEVHTEPLDRLHLILDTTPSLRKTYTNLKIKVLEPAHEAITTNTSLKYTYEPVKQGRKVVAVRFKFKSKTKYRKAPPRKS